MLAPIPQHIGPSARIPSHCGRHATVHDYVTVSATMDSRACWANCLSGAYTQRMWVLWQPGHSSALFGPFRKMWSSGASHFTHATYSNRTILQAHSTPGTFWKLSQLDNSKTSTALLRHAPHGRTSMAQITSQQNPQQVQQVGADSVDELHSRRRRGHEGTPSDMAAAQIASNPAESSLSKSCQRAGVTGVRMENS
jgi:hypothetical protein